MTEEHGLSSEQVEALARKMFGFIAWEPGPNQTADDYARSVAEFIAPTVAAMLADAEKRGEVAGLHSAANNLPVSRPGQSQEWSAHWLHRRADALAARYTATAAQEGTTEECRLRAHLRGPRLATPHDCQTCRDCLHDGQRCCGCYDGACCQDDPTCGERHGDMRCQLRRGHAGAHEDYSGMVR